MKIKSPASAYIFFPGLFYAIAILSIGVAIFKNPSAWMPAIVMASIAIGISIWTHGFYLEVNKTHFIYRNGMYRKKIIPLTSIMSIEKGSVYWKNIGKSIGMPCIIVRHKEGTFDINTAMFKPGLLNLLKDTLKK